MKKTLFFTILSLFTLPVNAADFVLSTPSADIDATLTWGNDIRPHLTQAAGDITAQNELNVLSNVSITDGALNILADSATPSTAFKMYGSQATSTSVVNLVPSGTATDSRFALDLWPKGTPSDNAELGVSWVHVCDTDPSVMATSNECIGVGKFKDGVGHVSSYAGGTGTLRDLNLQANGGNVGIGIGTTAPAYQLDVGGSGRFTGGLIGQSSTASVPVGNVGEIVTANCNPASPSGTTVTISIASPAVVTWSGHNMDRSEGATACPIKFSTTGSLPTGIVAGTTYWSVPASSSTLNIATTPENAVAGTFINTSGSQSGTQRVVGGADLVSNTWDTGSALYLTEGVWDIQGQCIFIPDSSTEITGYFVGINNTAATPGYPDQSYAFYRATYPTGAASSVIVPTKRIYVSTPDIYYGVGMSTFTTSDMVVGCQTSAVRAN